MKPRAYLDWNATAPLRPEARAAMLAAMDAVGNPSSVHAEGRAARAIVETARAEVAALVGADRDQVVFTSGATEAAYMTEAAGGTAACATDHAATFDVFAEPREGWRLAVDRDGRAIVSGDDIALLASRWEGLAVNLANNETGVIQDIAGIRAAFGRATPQLTVDMAQAAGRIAVDFRALGCDFAILSGHKLGAAAGVGALLTRDGATGSLHETRAPEATHERGLRAGTENVIGIAGFGAAAAAARRDLDSGVWDRVEKLRNILEDRISDVSSRTIFPGSAAARLPNTSCILTPGWRGETQVMQLDLAGFAVSSGAACSSGKVGSSRVLRAMGFDEADASCAIRVSLGPTTTEDEIHRFADAWAGLHAKRRARAA